MKIDRLINGPYIDEDKFDLLVKEASDKGRIKPVVEFEEVGQSSFSTDEAVVFLVILIAIKKSNLGYSLLVVPTMLKTLIDNADKDLEKRVLSNLFYLSQKKKEHRIDPALFEIKTEKEVWEYFLNLSPESKKIFNQYLMNKDIIKLITDFSEQVVYENK